MIQYSVSGTQSNCVTSTPTIHVWSENIQDHERIFPLGYTRAREIVKSAGKKIGIAFKIDARPFKTEGNIYPGNRGLKLFHL